MNWGAIAKQAVGVLVESGFLNSTQESGATAVVLANLKASPPDIAKDYNAAKAALLGDADEIIK